MRARNLSEIIFWAALVLLLIIFSVVKTIGPAGSKSAKGNKNYHKVIRQAYQHLDNGRPDRALKEFHRAVKLSNRKTDTYLTAFYTFTADGSRSIPYAIDVAKEIIELNDARQLDRVLKKKELAVLLGQYGGLCYSAGRNQEGIDALERAVSLWPDNPWLANDLGYFYAENDIHLKKALKLTKQAVKAEPHNAMYIDSLGWVYYKLGRYKEAVDELERAVRLSRNDPELRYHLGEAYVKLGKNARACIELDKTLLLSPSHTNAKALNNKLKAVSRHKPRNL